MKAYEIILIVLGAHVYGWLGGYAVARIRQLGRVSAALMRTDTWDPETARLIMRAMEPRLWDAVEKESKEVTP